MMIRPYKNTDKDNLLHILRLNTPKFFDASEAPEFAEYLDKLREEYFVVEEEGQVLGSGGINYFTKDKIARISWDVVHPNAQGKGLGSQLIRFRVNKIKENLAIETIVVRTSQVVYRFYEKCGFTLRKVEKDYWAPGFDLYYMEMKAN